MAAARAVLVQASADEKRYAALVKGGLAATPQRYEQAKPALDTAQAQLDAAEAEADVARTRRPIPTLTAGADGTVVATLGDPGRSSRRAKLWFNWPMPGRAKPSSRFPETISAPPWGRRP